MAAKVCATALVAALMGWVPVNASAQIPTSGAPTDAQSLHVVSEIKGLDFTLQDKLLPKAPGPVQDRNECDNYVVRPVSAAGSLVAARGWAVTGEAVLGAYRVVSFAGKFGAGTSAHCSVEQGNIGIFDGTKLVALAYAPKGSKESIGKIVILDGGGLRVWSGDDLSAPVGDIQIVQGELRLGALPTEDSFCRGKVQVPNIYELPIDKARKILIDKGWKPVASESTFDPKIFSREADFVKHGIIEVDSCAGTGYGFCAFHYKNASASLSVTTAGDGETAGDTPPVVDYDVSCR